MILYCHNVCVRGLNIEKTIIRSYKNGFSGFAAKLTKDEAQVLRRKAGVVSVFADPIYQPHTTRSWDFLQQTAVLVDSSPNSDGTTPSPPPPAYDPIIGLLDTGIWPESESFNDEGFEPIPSRWKGVCMEGSDFNASNCNSRPILSTGVIRKLIGARYYDTDEAALTKPTTSPRDELGHGTHTSSTAAGAHIPSASFYGLAPGSARGGAPSARIAMYRVCSFFGCAGSAILAGFDDAVADGVDLLSISLGASAFIRPDFSEDPIAIGAFHAVARGITVACSAGNDGPGAESVVNAAPWILTVAATTIDRDFESDIVLGGNRSAVKVIGGALPKPTPFHFTGEAINFSNLDKSPTYPLIYGASAKSNSSSEDSSASHCEPGTLDGNKMKGKIVLCNHSQSDTPKMAKIDTLNSTGAVGAILVNDLEQHVATTYEPGSDDLTTITVTKYKPAPAVAYFSSRGPSSQTSNILKPDIAAPGVNILASWIPTSEVPVGQKPSQFNLVSGTSMACPHVAGVAATIKAWNPTWTPAAIRSAIMTSATQVSNDKDPLKTDSGSEATAYDYGAGEVNPNSALQPGLVYELGPSDYIQFLCHYGYDSSTIRRITAIPDGFECPKNASKDLISDLNYPSIAISNLSYKESRTVKRSATDVGSEEESTYSVSINSPQGLDVKVIPDKLQFGKSSKMLSFQVTFSAQSSSAKGDLFGSIIWSDGTHRVRSPFVVRVAS
ncbi:CO(2)-response secreted protease [Ananas comosus]|uniref:CO(2)-response secreted protease n=1 Tax=Ananas comosus TaxID=4615 RepID=A0A199W9Y0_ANACO|nr:CO(2)-response secreted protease [Ananas comosus]